MKKVHKYTLNAFRRSLHTQLCEENPDANKFAIILLTGTHYTGCFWKEQHMLMPEPGTAPWEANKSKPTIYLSRGLVDTLLERFHVISLNHEEGKQTACRPSVFEKYYIKVGHQCVPDFQYCSLVASTPPQVTYRSSGLIPVEP